MSNILSLDTLFSTGESYLGQLIKLKAFLVMEVNRCYLLHDDKSSGYDPKIEIYAPDLENKIRKITAGDYFLVGSACLFNGDAEIVGVLNRPTVTSYRFSLANIKSIILYIDAHRFAISF